MRNNHKWLAVLLCMVLMIHCIGIRASAAQDESPVRLYASPAVEPETEFVVQIIASEAQTVADGKLVVTYDPEALTYVSTTAGAAWKNADAVTLSVNAAEGKIILAFASADAADAGAVFALTFQSGTIGNSTVALEGSSYITDAGSVSDQTLVCVSSDCVSVRLLAGDHGTFADGSAETTITTLAGAVMNADLLMPIVANRGYALTGWMTDDGTICAPDELELIPSDGMTLTAQYTFVCDGGESCPSVQFTDVGSLSAEAHAAVDFMVDNGYMNGMSSTIFAPYTDLNRAMMVTILHRIAGTPEADGECAFTDVSDERSYYYDAVIWAAENGITNGISEKLFAPDKLLSREELVTFLYRFAKHMGDDVSAAADLSGYTDTDEIGKFAVEAFRWAVATGVIKGTRATTLSPADTTTREQVCLMLCRLLSAQN